jgi:hypothetical protein
MTQRLRHWNCAFLASREEHAIPCGAKCYHINLSIVTSNSYEHRRVGKCSLQRSRSLVQFDVALSPSAVGRIPRLEGE